MKHLYAPWRENYVVDKSESLTTQLYESCIFCAQLEEHADKKNFIIKRFKYNAVFLNIYPYNAGHLLVVPYQHSDNLTALEQSARAEMMEIITRSINILNEQLHSQGSNVGFNIGGKAAGGSIPEHIHAHVLPRWLGDTNFLPVLAHTKPITTDLPAMYEELLPFFNALRL